MAVGQRFGPKPGQACGRSPGLGDQSCCYLLHSHCLPGSGHLACITQVASSPSVMTVRPAWLKSCGRNHPGLGACRCALNPPFQGRPRSQQGPQPLGPSLVLPPTPALPSGWWGRAESCSPEPQSLAAQTPPSPWCKKGIGRNPSEL